MIRSVIVMLCAMWYYLYKVKNVKNTHGGVLLLVKLQALVCSFTKSSTPPWVFFTFFNCTNDTKSHNASQCRKIIGTDWSYLLWCIKPRFDIEPSNKDKHEKFLWEQLKRYWLLRVFSFFLQQSILAIIMRNDFSIWFCVSDSIYVCIPLLFSYSVIIL